jgi:hypothetical protein
MPREKYPANSPQIFLFFLKKKKMQYGKTSYARQDQTWWCPYRKAVAQPAFSVFPKSTCKILLREIGGKTQLVPRLHTKYNKQDKQSNLMP